MVVLKIHSKSASVCFYVTLKINRELVQTTPCMDVVIAWDTCIFEETQYI